MDLQEKVKIIIKERMKDKIDDISKITKELITSIGEDLNREGLEKDANAVAKAWGIILPKVTPPI